MFCFYLCIILSNHNHCCDCTVPGYSYHRGWLTASSISKLRQQACNGTLQDQQRRWKKKHFEQLMCQNQNTEEFLHQNQHKKGKNRFSLRYLLADVLSIIPGLLFLFLPFFFSLKKEPEQMGNAKKDERCLKSNPTSLWNTTAWCCSAEGPCFFIFSLEQTDCSARYKSYAEAHASLFYFKSVCCQTWLSGISSFIICSVD